MSGNYNIVVTKHKDLVLTITMSISLDKVDMFIKQLDDYPKIELNPGMVRAIKSALLEHKFNIVPDGV